VELARNPSSLTSYDQLAPVGGDDFSLGRAGVIKTLDTPPIGQGILAAMRGPAIGP
jgi:hypothetical protein